MLTFDSDDNDDNLNLDNSKKQEPSKIPSSPFGKPSANGVNRPAEKPAAGNKLPVKPTFGTSAPQKPSSFPPQGQNKQLPPRLPANPTQKKPSFLPAQPQVAAQEPTEPVVSQEEEDFLQRFINKNNDANAQQERVNTFVPTPSTPAQALPPQQQQVQEPVQQFIPEPVQQQFQQPVEFQNPQPQAQPVQDFQTPGFQEQNPAPTTETEPKAKKSPWAKKEKSPKTPKTGKAAKENAASKKKPEREKPYDGDRKTILWIRVIAGTVAVVVGLAGLKALFLPDNGLSEAQVTKTAQTAVNYTGFPTVSGEQFSLDFAKVYFNYTSNDPDRTANLEKFASEDLVTKIDLQILSADEYDKEKGNSSVSYNDYSVSQKVTYGPYVVATDNRTPDMAVFTVKVGIDSGAVIYLDVPVKYDPKNFSLTLAGPPSFVKPNQNKGKTTADDYTANFGEDDQKIEQEFTPDLEAYLTAWGQSDSTIVDRYVLDSATPNAKNGLQNAVKFYSLDSFTVEKYDDARPETATQRRAEITVTWEDPKTGVRYPQQYRILLGMNNDKSWSVYDIENFAILN
jgi:hypothetical protein